MNYKQLITKLQILPKVAVPVATYPEKKGSYGISKYYCTAQDITKVDSLIGYLALLNDWKDIVLPSRKNRDIQRLSNDICQGIVTPHSKTKAIHKWVFSKINYRRTSSIVPPKDLIKTKVGDCKSFSVLLATLLGIQNIPCWFKLVQLKGVKARHVYNYAHMSWFPVDGTGYFCFEEAKRVIGYILFEVDKTVNSPPKPLPSPIEAEEVPPIITVEELEGVIPFVGMAGLLYLISRR